MSVIAVSCDGFTSSVSVVRCSGSLFGHVEVQHMTWPGLGHWCTSFSISLSSPDWKSPSFTTSSSCEDPCPSSSPLPVSSVFGSCSTWATYVCWYRKKRDVTISNFCWSQISNYYITTAGVWKSFLAPHDVQDSDMIIKTYHRLDRWRWMPWSSIVHTVHVDLWRIQEKHTAVLDLVLFTKKQTIKQTELFLTL